MASYRDKINQEKMSTESGKIAWCIDWLNHDRKLMREAEIGFIDLFDDIRMRRDDAGLAWIIERPVEYKANRFRIKIVPRYLIWEQTTNVLDVQPWQYI